jgi:glycosyltransferase involved in cell wall biosynthesis
MHVNQETLKIKPLISIVLGSFNRRRYLPCTINSIRDNNILVPYEIIVIDGGSKDGSLRWLLRQKDIITIVQHNHGFWKGQSIPKRSWGYYMNIAFKATHGKYIVMISDDCILLPGAIQNAYNFFEKQIVMGHKIGGLAFYFRHWPVFEKKYFVMKLFGLYYNVNHGMYLRSVIEKIGWFDEDNYYFKSGDSDLSIRIYKAGYNIVPLKESLVEHSFFAHQKQSLDKKADCTISEQTLIQKWGQFFKGEKTIDKEYIQIPQTHRITYNFIKAEPIPHIWFFFKKKAIQILLKMRNALRR